MTKEVTLTDILAMGGRACNLLVESMPGNMACNAETASLFAGSRVGTAGWVGDVTFDAIESAGLTGELSTCSLLVLIVFALPSPDTVGMAAVSWFDETTSGFTSVTLLAFSIEEGSVAMFVRYS